MATYTMTLKEYITAGGTLPTALFNMIPAIQIAEGVQKTFTMLFTHKYQYNEIAVDEGTQAEMIASFNDKLEAKAEQLCPFYSERITIISNALAQPFTRTNTRTVSNNGSVANYEQPTGTSSFENSDITSGQKSNGGATETNTGISERTNKLDLVIAYQDNIKNQYEMLLDDFKGLFIGVF